MIAKEHLFTIRACSRKHQPQVLNYSQSDALAVTGHIDRCKSQGPPKTAPASLILLNFNLQIARRIIPPNYLSTLVEVEASSVGHCWRIRLVDVLQNRTFFEHLAASSFDEVHRMTPVTYCSLGDAVLLRAFFFERSSSLLQLRVSI